MKEIVANFPQDKRRDTDVPCWENEELTSEELRSTRTAVEAIRCKAAKHEIDSLTMWYSIEEKLCEKSVIPDFEPDKSVPWNLALISALAIPLVMALGYYIEWGCNGFTFTSIVIFADFVLLYTAHLVPKWRRTIRSALMTFTSTLFTISLTVYSLIPVNNIFRTVLFFLLAMLFWMTFCTCIAWILEIQWSRSIARMHLAENQLAIIRATLPVLLATKPTATSNTESHIRRRGIRGLFFSICRHH